MLLGFSACSPWYGSVPRYQVRVEQIRLIVLPLILRFQITYSASWALKKSKLLIVFQEIENLVHETHLNIIGWVGEAIGVLDL